MEETILSHNQEILFKAPRTINAQFLKAFSAEYNRLKEKGLQPKQIWAEMQKLLKCGQTAIVTYVRLSREAGYIQDSFQENKEAMNRRNSELMKKTMLKPKPSVPVPSVGPCIPTAEKTPSLWSKVKAIFS